MIYKSTHAPPGEQHDFRLSHEERAQDALDFFRAELPNAHVRLDADPAVAPTRMIVVENCNHTEERIENLADSLKGIVVSVMGAEHYPDGANIVFSA